MNAFKQLPSTSVTCMAHVDHLHMQLITRVSREVPVFKNLGERYATTNHESENLLFVVTTIFISTVVCGLLV